MKIFELTIIIRKQSIYSIKKHSNMIKSLSGTKIRILRFSIDDVECSNILAYHRGYIFTHINANSGENKYVNISYQSNKRYNSVSFFYSNKYEAYIHNDINNTVLIVDSIIGEKSFEKSRY